MEDLEKSLPNPKSLQKKIELIVDIYTNYLKFLALGPHSVPRRSLIDLITRGFIKQEDALRPRIRDTYLITHLKYLIDQSSKDARERTIAHLESEAGKWIDNWRTRATNQLTSVVERNLMDAHRQATDPIIRQTLRDTFGKKTAANIAAELRKKTGDLHKDWLRVVNTELANASNMGAHDAILANHKGQSHDEIYVYKVGPHDSLTCRHCYAFWFLNDKVTPKVYKLSELEAGGNNFGRKVADWQPTVGSTHPNERHLLFNIQPGWGFQNGQLSYIVDGHNEYESQRALR